MSQPAYVPTAVNQFFSWALFGAVFLVSWDGALTTGVNRLNSDVDAVYLPGSARVLRRPYLIALCLYTLVVAWFNIVFLMLLGYCACALVWMTAPLCKLVWESLVRRVFVPSVVFNCMDSAHAPFHGAVALGTVFAASITAGFYMTDGDLVLERHMQSKAARALFVPPAAMGIAYALYMCFCMVAATTPQPLNPKDPKA